MIINFWSTKGIYGCFSNFSRHPITYKYRLFATSEHLYQWLKLGNGDVETPEQFAVRMESNPKLAKDLANSNKNLHVNNWHDIKYNVMLHCCRLKCEQHPKIKDVLVQTGEAEIVENSPYDYEWGCGADGSGKNLLGKVWMQIRNEVLLNRQSATGTCPTII